MGDNENGPVYLGDVMANISFYGAVSDEAAATVILPPAVERVEPPPVVVVVDGVSFVFASFDVARQMRDELIGRTLNGEL